MEKLTWTRLSGQSSAKRTCRRQWTIPGPAPGAAGEVVAAHGRARSERAGRFLSLLYPALADKRLQKLAKKDLFRLKTLGISVEEPKASGESVLRKMETFRDAMGLMSNYDAAQTKSSWQPWR